MTTVLTHWRTVYKLTDADGCTRHATRWGVGVVNPCGVLSGRGGLCGPGFYHGYHTPELAAFLNPLGAAFDARTMRFWRAEIRGTVEEERGQLKIGASEMRTLEEIPALRPTMRQRTAFAILIAQGTLDVSGLSIPAWESWANDWLDGRRAAESVAESVAESITACAAARDAACAAACVTARGAACAAARAADIIVDAAILALTSDWEVVQ